MALKLSLNMSFRVQYSGFRSFRARLFELHSLGLGSRAQIFIARYLANRPVLAPSARIQGQKTPNLPK